MHTFDPEQTQECPPMPMLVEGPPPHRVPTLSDIYLAITMFSCLDVADLVTRLGGAL